MNKIIVFFLMILLVSCATKAITGTFDDTYGYSEKNPIKVGEHSPANSNRYLSSLTGPNDEEVTFGRVGSCCSFKTKNALFGDSGLLDRYWVTYDGKKDTIYLYVNIYDKAELGTPKGFKRK
ncbi:2-dehydro-3-deoxyphosphooctonate aldolase [Elizabethkingia meningoseptica]|uniref:2-dehydro-3-deoxyphosphooctonate aldolase n=1 Tax=Elizabethkingia meningoseptica TaxID=238 RepID=UPI00301A2EAE